MFNLSFEPTGTDFDGGIPEGIVSTLREIANRIERVGIDWNDPRKILDTSGNSIGEFRLDQPELIEESLSRRLDEVAAEIRSMMVRKG